MHAALDLTQSNWRFHTALGIHPTPGDLAKHPALESGTSSDVVLCFKKYTVPTTLKEDVALTGVWYESHIAKVEDRWDYKEGKGLHRVKVIPAVNAAGELNQVIQIYQTDYRWTTGDYENDITIYTGRLMKHPVGEGQFELIFFGFGADNAGRQWLTFSLTPPQIKI